MSRLAATQLSPNPSRPHILNLKGLGSLHEMYHAHFRHFSTAGGKEEQKETGSTEGGGTSEKDAAEEVKATPEGEGEGNTDEKVGGAEDPNEVEQLKTELTESRKKLLMAYAEMENVRTIARRDVDNAKTYAIQGFAKHLLDVMDNLTRAVAAVPPEAAHDKDGHPHLTALVEGLDLTQMQLMKVFQSHGLKQFGEVGEKFDPNLHDAMFEYEDPSGTPGSIGQLLKTGYKLHDRVIRPAQVGTIKASSPKP